MTCEPHRRSSTVDGHDGTAGQKLHMLVILALHRDRTTPPLIAARHYLAAALVGMTVTVSR